MQQTDVGQGLAVGCLLVGVVGVTSSKLAVEDAFRRAWAGWARAGDFPAVRASLERNDIMAIAHDGERRRSGWIAFWDTDGRWWEPVLRHDRTAREAVDELAASSGVPAAEWESLARAFVAALGDDGVVPDADRLDGDDDALEDDHEPRGPDDDSGYGPDSYYAHAMGKDD